MWGKRTDSAATDGSPWRGVLLIVVLALLLGIHPGAALIGVAIAAWWLERTSPETLDALIDKLTF